MLLVAAFPGFNQPWCAWVGLIPWLLLLYRLDGKQAFWWSYAIGAVFFLASIWWLVYVTLLGWVVLCAYLALFFAAFGWVSQRALKHAESPWPPLFLVPAYWVILEYLRSHLLSGFGWNLLGYSQASWLPVIQLADVTGVWGISFVIVFFNQAAALCLEEELSSLERSLIACAAVFLVTAMIIYGTFQITFHAGRIHEARTFRVSVIQGNVPQEDKWNEAFYEDILQRYEALTEKAAQARPDLIVWPETSTPGYLGADEDLTQRIIRLAQRAGVEILAGEPFPKWTSRGMTLVNRATLTDLKGSLDQYYDKLHLVPFGEFIPGDYAFPVLRKILPPIGNFVEGHEETVFRGKNDTPFSVLICFEDVFPELARNFVRRGAQFLLVITNDAWFGPTAAAYQHAQASTLRAVELRVPVARAANTGWSGCIDSTGRWTGAVSDAGGRELFVEGWHACSLPLESGNSFYVQLGDWFVFACLVLSIFGLFVIRR